MKELFEAFSPSGNEECMRELLERRLKGIFDRMETDNLGNLIASSGNDGICIECGMDSPGIMVVSKTDTRVYFASVGGIKPAELAERTVVFGNGNTGTVKYDETLDIKSAKVSDLYIEMDNPNINIGDFGTVVTEFAEDENGLCGYGLKSRIGLAVVCSALKAVDKTENVTVVFSAQKRLGARGIRAYFNTHSFDRVITVDSCSNDGCSIIAKDAKAVASVGIRKELEKIVAENDLDAKTVVCEDGFYIEQFLISDNLCGAVGVPVLCKEDEQQGVNKSDFDTAVKLLTAVLKDNGIRG